MLDSVKVLDLRIKKKVWATVGIHGSDPSETHCRPKRIFRTFSHLPQNILIIPETFGKILWTDETKVSLSERFTAGVNQPPPKVIFSFSAFII